MPQPHGGAIKARGNPGNKGGPGRPPNELRERMRELGWVALEEVLARVQASRRTVPPRAHLQKMTKDELIELLEGIREWIEISPNELRQILDTAAKYGIGTKHVHSGEDDGPIQHAVFLLPSLDDETEEGEA